MIRKADLPCSSCGASDDELICSGREHEYDNTTQELFNVVRCRRCGLVRLNPRPDVSELPTIYPSSYYAYNLVALESARAEHTGSRSLVQEIKRRMYQRRLAQILHQADLGSGTIRVLDVGCGDGRLLEWYRTSSAGHRIETYGIDMSERAIEIARNRGHRVVLGRFEEERELPLGAFDLILSNHVIEHVAEPQRFIAHASDLLAPGGLLVLETPNYDSPDVRFFGSHWGGHHFPRHWTFYEAGSLARLGQSVGLDVERVEYQANPIFWNWSFHSLLHARLPAAADVLFPPVAIFHASARSFLLLSIFTIADLALKTLTGKTASMAVSLRKPKDGAKVAASSI
jgi:2-polyprenyl-3-methyl-5-hydroxy-6-metoxy-1,4-benzoquinol methylase